jgi:hypothetical protein
MTTPARASCRDLRTIVKIEDFYSARPHRRRHPRLPRTGRVGPTGRTRAACPGLSRPSLQPRAGHWSARKAAMGRTPDCAANEPAQSVRQRVIDHHT